MATNVVAKMGQNYLPPCIYRSVNPKRNGISLLYVHVNSANDASISCKNFVNFGAATPEKTGLICILFYEMAKTGIFSQISQDILDRFLQSFHRMKTL